MNETECCPRFNPEPWDGKMLEWNRKTFIRDKVFTLFYIPITFSRVIKRMMGQLEKSGAQCPDWLCLSDHTSKWNMDLYLAVDKPVAEAENFELSGRFFSKVYEGDFNQTGAWCRDFEAVAGRQGLTVKKWYMWYTTCPKCAKKFGKNYVVVVGQV
ncbi:MAG: hypothetical protein KBA26_01005 [Candidatus Delongbacteria bacterium]|nr:hypothetical protein [Candidatus Delongbacteria bacterium]